MATWTTRTALRGTNDRDDDDTSQACSSSSSSSSPSTPSTPLSPSSPWSDEAVITPSESYMECMEDSGFQDCLEVQLGVTGEMSVVERLQYLLDTGQFADVNIRVGQGNNINVFKAHRLLLATASQPLYKLVSVNATPGPNDITTIRIADMRPDDFKHILKYIYTDNIDCNDIKVAFELLRASRRWGLAGLGIKSLNYLEEFLDKYEPKTEDHKSNLFELLVLSEDALSEMSRKCWDLLIKYAEQVIPCEGYLNLDKRMIAKVICHQDLKMENQLKLFEAIRDWGLHYLEKHGLKLSQLANVVEELIKVVDFEKVSDSDFLNTVLTSECLGKAEVIAFFMTHGLEIPKDLDFNNNKQLPFWLWFSATSDMEAPRCGRPPNKVNRKGTTTITTSSRNLATVNETLSKICSLTQNNGSVLEFNKVCRFKKGYRCPQKEICQEHELRFRVDKNIKLLGVGFGFLFSSTDMGINVHCQGPWETRQWTDISQSYCRVAGEKMETADVRLMFLQPVRIDANHCYKVLVKTVRMSQGSSEVELWGGMGGMYNVETEDAEFHFIKAAIDPDKPVEESDGDTNPGVITELLYLIDNEEREPVVSPIRRRRPPPPEEETPPLTQTNIRSRRRRTESTNLIMPDTSLRKRSTSDDVKSPEAPPYTRRRESIEEYKPTSFSTNRWRIKRNEERKPEDNEVEKKSVIGEYTPSSFSTNRWRTRPKENTETTEKKAAEEYLPSSFSTNRWRTRTRDPGTASSTTVLGDTRRTSLEDSRWRPKAQEEKKDTVFGNRVFAKPEEKTTTTPAFMRRRESKDTDVPFFLRKTEDSKTFGSSTSSDSAPRSRFLRSGDGSLSSASSLRSTGSTSLLSSRFGAGRESSLSRSRDSSSLSRYGGSSGIGSSYLSRYDSSSKPDTSSSGISDSSSQASGRYGSTSTDAYTPSSSSVSDRHSSSASSRPALKYGTSTSGSDGSLAALLNKYGTNPASSTSSSCGIAASSSRYNNTGSTPSKYRSAGSGSNLLALSDSTSSTGSRYGSSASAESGMGSSIRARSSYKPSVPAGGYASCSLFSSSLPSSSSRSTGTARYGSSAAGSGTTSSRKFDGLSSYDSSSKNNTSSRYGASSHSGRYGTTAAASAAGRSERLGSPALSSLTRPTSSSRYSSPAPGASSRYSSPVPSLAGRYSSPAPAVGTSK